jgi:hypothetical protein
MTSAALLRIEKNLCIFKTILIFWYYMFAICTYFFNVGIVSKMHGGHNSTVLYGGL